MSSQSDCYRVSHWLCWYTEWQTIAEGSSVKTDASGAAMSVWQDYVAGTDPTNAQSKFTAKIEMKDGALVGMP